MNDIENCPFCDSKAEVIEIKFENHRKYPEWVIKCKKCKSTGPQVGTKEFAKQLWNKRSYVLPKQSIETLSNEDEIDVKHKLFKDGKCPECKQGMLLLRTHSKKICIDCRIEYAWTLKEGQLPLIRHQRG